jgi:hypothetical protein
MLPGFRFLLAAIALCSSILVFGLGAAALLRAAHEEVAQNPSWRGTPEPRLAQFEETPVLAMLRIEPVAAESDILEAPASPASAPSAATEAEASAIAFPTSDDDKAVAPHASESSPPIETAETDAPSAQTSTPAEVLPAPTLPGTATSSNIASVEQASRASDEQPLAAAPVLEPMVAEPEADAATTKTATLGTPPSAVDAEATKNEVDSEQDREEAKKRLRAERAKERRRLAARRARLAEQAAIDPFGQLIRQAQLTQQAQLAAAKRKTR